jgi:large subunit ribosomal protein L28e
MASPDLLWQLVKKNNSFLVKRNGNNNASVQFSSEPNNLYNLNTFKYSGLANRKTVAIVAAGEGLNVALSTTKTKKGNQPAVSVNTSVLKRDFRKMARAVVNQVAENGYRADLKEASLARLAAVHKSLRVAKAGVGKKSSKGPRKALRK